MEQRDDPAQSISEVDSHQKKVILSGGISKVLFILSCSQGTKISIQMSTVTS